MRSAAMHERYGHMDSNCIPLCLPKKGKEVQATGENVEDDFKETDKEFNNAGINDSSSTLFAGETDAEWKTELPLPLII